MLCVLCMCYIMYICRTNHKFSLLFLLCLRTQCKQPKGKVRLACEAVLPVKKTEIKSKNKLICIELQ